MKDDRYAMRFLFPSEHKTSSSFFSTNCSRIQLNPSSQKPLPRSGHRVCSTARFLYSFGGYKPSSGHEHSGPFSELWQFDCQLRKWTLLCNSGPQETASHSMLWLNHCLVIFGGTSFPWGHQVGQSLHVFHILTKKWFTLPCSGDFPSRRYGHTMNVHEGFLYVIGGTTGILYNMSIHRLDLKSLAWVNISPPNLDGSSYQPEPRYRHESALFEDSLVILGGVASDVIFDLVNLLIFDLRSRVWSSRKSLACIRVNTFPCSRKFFGSCQFNEFLYICGGIIHGIPLCDIWRLSLKSFQWEKLPQQLPIPLYFHAVSITPTGCMYIFGGVEMNPNEKRSNRLFRMWLVVPSLKDMILEVFPRLSASSI